MKKYITGIAILFSICMINGCGAQSPAVDENNQNMTHMSQNDTAIDNENMTQASETESAADDENQNFASKRGSAIQETKDAVYFFLYDCIYALDNASEQVRILWQSEQYTPNSHMAQGCGVIASDKIYFLEYSSRYERTVLSVVNTDGSGYREAVSKLDETSDLSRLGETYEFCGIYCSENVLYAYGRRDVRCYRLADDGSLDGEIPWEETAFRYTRYLSEDYSLPCLNYGYHDYLSPVESMERFGSLIMHKGTSYVKIDVESGNEEWVNFGAPTFIKGDKVYYISSASDVQTLESFDLNTKETETVCEIENEVGLCAAYADGVFYYMDTKKAEHTETTVGFCSLSDKTSGVLFGLDEEAGYTNDFLPSNFGLRIAGENLYYVDMWNYDAYLVKAPLDNPSQRKLLTEPIYRTRISEVGGLASEYHEIYSETNPDVLLGTANFHWLTVDDSFAGAETINHYLYEAEIASAWSMFEDNTRADEEIIAEYATLLYSYDSDISCIRYFDGTYVSFLQENYEDYGGAHGLPFRNGYTFDLNTGERLLLLDIISNTEEELKDIVTSYFKREIDEYPEDFWADAEETVHDTVNLETTDFVLTDDGICFYMYPYSIAAYVEGFPDVTIPYSEFDMKILE